ncbi:hypothetical protein POMI540_4554 [Schizosaccharomyces pombe]
MDFLKEEIERKRRQLEGTSELPVKKAFRRGDWEKEREKKYLQEKQQKDEQRELKKRKLEEERLKYEEKKLRISRLANKESSRNEELLTETTTPSPAVKASPASTKVSVSENDRLSIPEITKDNLTLTEIIAKLREMKEPIRLFGESEEATIQRYYSLLKYKKLEEIENELLTKGVETIDFEHATTTKPKVSKQVVAFLQHGIRIWDNFLSSKSINSFESSESQMQLKIFRQAKQDLDVLIQLIVDEALNDDIFKRIAEICYRCQKHEFVKANDMYLRLTIGNAPWPIGVTMVGIHERSAHQRLQANPSSNILKDEKKRKCLQALKRFITFQERESSNLPEYTD